MRITSSQLRAIGRSIDKMDAAVEQALVDAVTTSSTADELREKLLGNVKTVSRMSARNCETLAQSIFNAWRRLSVGETMDTVSADTWDEGKYDAAANTAAKAMSEGKTAEEVANIMMGRAKYDNRRAYGETMRANAAADPLKPRYARVPGYSKTYGGGCPFCRMLASRGFAYHSEHTAGKDDQDHYHKDCQCKVVCSWDDSPEVEGYDPSKYDQEYIDARAFVKQTGLESVRKNHTVGEKTHTTYRNGYEVGTRKEDYSDADYITAYDLSTAYNKLGNRKQNY